MPAVTPVTGKFGSSKVGFLVDGYNILAAKIQELRHKSGVVTERSDGLGDSWFEHTPTGDRFAELVQQGGFFDTTAGSSHAALGAGVPSSPQAANRVAVAWEAGNVVGQPMIGFQGAIQPDYEVLSTRGKLQRANASLLVSGKAEDGVILHALTQEVADANTEGSSVDNTTTPQRVVPITSSAAAGDLITCPVPHGLAVGDTVLISGHTGSTPSINGIQTVATVPSTTTFSISVDITVGGTGGSFVRAKTNNGGSAYLEMTALGLGTFTDALVTTRHSDDDSVFVDLVAFTARTVFGAERVTVAGAVRRYLAQNIDFRGAGSGGSATYMVGFARAA
jgi:hypothetical protein